MYVPSAIWLSWNNDLHIVLSVVETGRTVVTEHELLSYLYLVQANPV